MADDYKIRFIKSVIAVYGQYSAYELECMTHQEQPWIEAKSLGVMDMVISDIAMKHYYSDQEKTKTLIVQHMNLQE